MQWTTTIHTCNACGASWQVPKDEPHDCPVAAANSERDIYRLALERLGSYFTDAPPNEPIITGDAHGTLIAIRSEIRAVLAGRVRA